MPGLIEADIQGLAEAKAAVAGWGKAGERALIFGVRRAIRRAGSQIARGVAAESHVPLRTITRRGRGRRLYVKEPKAGQSQSLASVWLGINPIRSGYLGTPRKARGGARVAGVYFEGGFLARMRSGYLGVFKRRGEDRLPIDDQVADLEASRGVVEKVAADSVVYLRDEVFERLNYEVNIKR